MIGHRLQFNWIFMLLMGTVYVTQGTFVQNLYTKLEPGRNIAGTGTEQLAQSIALCSLW